MNVYSIVTKKIIDIMNEGVIPWNRPWHGGSGGPRSYTTGRPYSWLNQMILGGQEGEYISFRQAKALGGKIKKGSKSNIIVFFKRYKVKDTDREGNPVLDEDGKQKERIVPLLKYYNVFKVDDVEGIEPHKTDEPKIILNPDKAAEEAISAYCERTGVKLNIRSTGRAFYDTVLDAINVPELLQYDDRAEYYSTLFHEIIHSTGAQSRLDRSLSHERQEYSREELVAEMGSAMLCSRFGIDTKKSLRNSAAYIQSWKKYLSSDEKAVVWASSRAEKAARYFLGEEDGDGRDQQEETVFMPAGQDGPAEMPAETKEAEEVQMELFPNA